MEKQVKTNGQILQGVIGDNLFPEVQNVSDVKQVLELMKETGQNLREEQVKALVLLEQLGENKFLHPEGNPYKKIIKEIQDKYKIAVVSPSYYLDTIEELIPKPPKPIIMTERGKPVTVGGR